MALKTPRAEKFRQEVVYVHGPGAFPYMTMFATAGFQMTDDINNATIVCFTGGEDVNPALYGEPNRIIQNRGVSRFSTQRDDRDAYVFGLNCANKVLQIGICRGGQFLNVMNGGRMWQHVNGHVTPHNLVDAITGEVVKVTSTHHQMMRPSAEGEVIASAREASFKYAEPDEWHIEQDAEINPGLLEDVEVVWYEESKCLCFQPHPEFADAVECREYFLSLIERIIH